MKRFLPILVILISQFSVHCQKSVSTNDIEANENPKKYLRQVRSPNEDKRSLAAWKLYKMKHPKALDACIRTINDAPDILHCQYTSSMSGLTGIGEPALLPVLDLLLSRKWYTRERAVLVINEITYELFKASKVSEKLKPYEIQKEFRSWLKEIDLDHSASLEDRKAAIQRFKDWLKKGKWV